MTFKLTAQKRNPKANPDAIRSAGQIPAVFYGGGKDTTSVSLDEGEFLKVFREAGESTMIDLATEEGTKQVLVQDIQRDPVSGNVLHVDFKVIEAGKSIEVTVPLEFIGVSPAVKGGHGTLNKVMHEITLEVLPRELPSHIDVDISSLATLEDQILVQDLKVSAGKILDDAESAVAVISAAREEESEEPAEVIDFSSIEVEKKGKTESTEEGVGEESSSK
jgi:large subunit ribosomal protein L25